jgi:hypothetical protein
VFEKVIRVAAAELGWLEEVLDDVLRDGWPEGRTSAGFSATGEMA